MAKQFVNDMRQKRTGFETGSETEAKSIAGGAHGSGEEKSSNNDATKGKGPDFRPAKEFLGYQPFSEMDPPGLGLMKGASAVGYDAPTKGTPNVKDAGAAVRKPKAAEEAGH